MIQLKSFHPDSELFQISADVQLFKTSSGLLIKNHFQLSEELNKNTQWVSLDRKGQRADEIWKTTCFEFFLKTPSDDSYLEFNLNNRADWNLYFFNSYRNPQPATPWSSCQIKKFSFDSTKGFIESQIEIDLKSTLTSPQARVAEVFSQSIDFQFSITSIIESTNKNKSYWALAHVADKPDFHQAASFQLVRTIHGV